MEISIHQIRKLIFCIAYFVYVFYKITAHSMFSYDYSVIYNALGWVLAGFVFTSFGLFVVDSLKLGMKELLMYLILGAIMVLVVYKSNYKQIAFIVLLIISAKDIDFKTIVKVLIVSGLTSIIFVCGLCKFGVFEDVIYTRDINNKFTIVHSYGFTYYSYLSFIVLSILLSWGYLRDTRIKYIEIILMYFISLWVYKLTTDRLAYYVLILFLAMTFICKFFRNKFKENYIIKRLLYMLAIFGYFATFGITYYFVLKYGSNGKVPFEMDKSVIMRITLSYEGIKKYGIHWFGQFIQMYGNYQMKLGIRTHYFYIDSGYIYSILCYGIIFTISILVMYTFIFVYMVYKDKNMLIIWLIVIMVFSVINDMFVALEYNPLLMLLPNVVASISKSKHENNMELDLF